jgi:hypothetical protein
MATTERFILDFAVRGVQNIESARDKIDNLNQKVNGLATALLGVSFANFVSGALQAADRMVDFSDATNISIASLKALQASMDIAGGNSKNLERSINTLFAAIETANSGSQGARDAFEAVGVSLSDLRNLSEADILQKTLEGLAQMPVGAERSAVATQLLSRAMRNVDPKALIESLDVNKYIASQEASKKAAERIGQLEEAYRNLQEGALRAVEPILKGMGEQNLTVEAATKLVKGLGLAFAVLFGAQAVAAVAGMITALVNLNRTLTITAGISNLLGKGPLGILLKMGAAIGTVGAGVAALDALTKQNEEVAASADEAAKAQADLLGGATGRIQQATPTSGAANRRQELDATQKAVIESQKRIAQSRAEIEKSLALANASELERISIESAAEIAKAREDIFSKENISKAQKTREFEAKREEIERATAVRITELRRAQEAEINNFKNQYAQQNIQRLGQEITELDKINQLIAQQPARYKEIADQLRANAAIQDAEKRRIEEIIRLRDAERQATGLYYRDLLAAGAASRNLMLMQAQALGVGREELAILSARSEALQKLADLENLSPGAYEARLVAQGRSNELSQQQINLAKTYNEQLAFRKNLIQNELNDRILLAQTETKLAEDFAVGWEAAYGRFVENSRRSADQARAIFDTLSNGWSNAIVKFVQTGKLSFRDLFNDLIAQAVRASANRLLLSIFGGMFGGSGAGFLGSLFGGFRADGGPVGAGKAYVVGERGPEMFVPRQNGSIVPNDALAGGGGTQITNVNYSIQAVDASSFRSLVARDPEFLYNVTEQGRRQLPLRSRR